MDAPIERVQADVFPARGKVVVRFYSPGEEIIEVHLPPEVARDFAYKLTACSIDIPED